MKGVIDLGIWQVVLSYIFVLAAVGILKARGIRREREVFLSSLRMTLQLILAGYILIFVFDHPSPVATVLIVALMEGFAIYTVMRKFAGQLSAALKKAIAFSMLAGTLSCIMYFIVVVVQIDPWYDPQYFIPITGMLIGNSMTGVSLGVKSLVEGMTTQKSMVEEALILGATPKAATRSMLNSTFDAALMPTVNSMIGMGIVFLPGMMTGQILSGTLPATAVAYQIAIMFGILGAVSCTVVLMLQLGIRCFFNDQDQLVQ